MADDSDVVLGTSDDHGTTRARRGAALFDVIVLGWAVGVLAVPASQVAPLVAQASLLVLWLLLVVVEGATGRSPGKVVTGVEVVRDNGRPMDVVTAALRRPWGWLLPLQLLDGPARSISMLVAIIVLVVMLVTIERSDDRRGFHDRLAGTEVIAGTFDPRARLVVVLVTAGAALLGLILTAATAPITVA